jgi:DNA-binding transcriptional MerR regulator
MAAVQKERQNNMTIKQLSVLCGVSEQAVRAYCKRKQVAKDTKGNYKITKAVETQILSHYGADTPQDVAKEAKASCESKESTSESQIINILMEQLREKDKQIEQLQTIIQQAQSLHLLDVAKLESIETTAEETVQDVTTDAEPQEQKRGLFKRLFVKKMI